MRERAGAAQAGPFPAARSLTPACRRFTEAARPARSFRRPLAALVAAIAVFLAALSGLLPAAWAQEKEQEKDWRAVLAVSQAAMGREIGDFRFTDSKGREVAFADFRGRPLLVSFVYTGCFQACPVATKFLMEAVETARKALGDDRFSVVSIGFNQPFDNPVAMASFARQNGIDDPRWFFLTPRAGEVEALTQRFGFVYDATPKGFDHITQVTIVDPKGVIYRQVYGENFDLPMLVQPLKELLSGQASESFTVENVWEKVKLYCTVYDPNSGGYRVNYGIFFEIFAGLTTLGAIAWVVIRELRRRPRGA
jgi:protein SCO1/2